MLLLLFCLPLGLPAVLSATTADPNDNFINELTINGHFSKILDLIGSCLPGMLTQLVALDDVTLFLPTDAAMARVPADVMADLRNDTHKLRDLINFHVVANQSVKVRNRGSNEKVLTSLSGRPIRLNVYREPESIHAAEGVRIVEENIKVSNGFVQGLDGFMSPPQGDIVTILAQRPDMTTMTSLLATAGLVDVIKADKNITVFAPTDTAWSRLPANVTAFLGNHVPMLKNTLLYHVVDRMTLYSLGMRNAMTFTTSDEDHDKMMILEDYAGNIYLNRAKITELDISATNGVIHVIDDVIVPTEVLMDMEGAGVSLLG